MNPETKQTVLTLLKSLDNKSTMDSLVKAIHQILDFVKRSHATSVQEIGKLRQPYEDAIKKIQSELSSLSKENFGTMEAGIKADFVKQISSLEVDKIKNSIKELLDSKESDSEATIAKTLSRLPKVEPSKDLSPVIQELTTKNEALLKQVEELEKSTIQRFSSIPRGSGGNARGFQLYVGSTKKGIAQYVNLVAGSNMTVSDSLVNGLHTITFASSGGSGFTKLTATETPNSVLTVFTFSAASAQPSFLVVDGAWMQPTTALGTVNWTWASGTKKATLTIPANDDIYGIV